VVRLRFDEADTIVQAEFVDQQVRSLGLRVAVGTARAADDHELRGRVAEFVQRPDRDVGTLERLDATDEEQQ